MNRHILNHLMTIDLMLIMLKETQGTRSKRDMINSLESKRKDLEAELKELSEKAKIKFEKPIQKD